MAEPKQRLFGILGASWGLGGVTLIISMAIRRLTPYAVGLAAYHLTTVQWAFMAVFTVFMLVTEGYYGFQRGFAPRVAARALHLRRNPVPLHVVFAPFFCFAFFHTNLRRQLMAISMTMGIVVLVILVTSLAQPWRGIIDFGVVIGLIWGLACLGFFGYRAFTDPGFDRSPEVPATAISG